MKKLIKRLWADFLTAFGNVKVFKWPMFIVYDPSYFKMTGEKIAKVLDILEPGDVVLRGYDSYLDSIFIPDGKSYSHGSVYVGGGKIIHAVAKGVCEINALEFCECDRIAVLRPRKYKNAAVKLAKKFVKENIPYDFFFSTGASSLYCFELIAECYPKLQIKRKELKALFGLIKKYAYIGDSIFESPDFEIIFEYNPKHKIDFENKSSNR